MTLLSEQDVRDQALRLFQDLCGDDGLTIGLHQANVPDGGSDAATARHRF